MKDKNAKDYTYYSIMIMYIILIIGYLLYRYVFYNMVKIPECTTYKLFGIYCPGCGGTRAVITLFNGKFIASFLYNPIVFCFFIITAIYLISNSLARILKKDNLRIPFYKEFGYILLFILIVNCIVKNFLLFQYGIKII